MTWSWSGLATTPWEIARARRAIQSARHERQAKVPLGFFRKQGQTSPTAEALFDSVTASYLFQYEAETQLVKLQVALAPDPPVNP
jgi:hypothetical protein